MGENSSIQWTHHTFNAWIGCQRVSPGCEHCYAEALDERWRPGRTRWGPKAERTRTSAANWRKPLQWNKRAALTGVRERVFCASLSDVFEDRPELRPWRADLFKLIDATPALDWLLLTKRPENADGGMHQALRDAFPGRGPEEIFWPDNVWLGTTVEDQRRAEERIPHLIATDAVVKFLSVEPQLEAIDLDLGRCDDHDRDHVGMLKFEDGHEEEGCTECAADGFSGELSFGHWLDPYNGGINWVIQGGESGPSARKFNADWARSLAAQCKAAGVAYFLKQLGACLVDEKNHVAGRSLVYDAQMVPNVRRLADSHGGDMAEWPADLQKLGRAFPEVEQP